MVRIIVPLLILAVLGVSAWLIFSNPPESQRRGPPQGPQTVVAVMDVASRDFAVNVSSYGTVRPRTLSMLVAQVGGQVMQVNPALRPGGFFATGDVLASIDPRDYEANVEIARATLMEALQAQAEEQARAEQAEIDWQRLGAADEAPTDLVLRIPQLQAAQARVASARSNLTKAELNLERTRIKAPFDGRVLQQLVDLGQVVNTGSQVAQVYATDYVEVRLPVRNADLAFINLPEVNGAALPVTFQSELGTPTTWQGRVVRTEGAIDEVSRQLHVVAQIDEPFTARDGQRPLKIGEYVTAVISGRSLLGSIVIPTNTIYQNSYVYTVEEGILQRQDIKIAWQDGRQAIVASGLQVGDMLVTTPLGQVSSGTPVRIEGQSGRALTGADGVAR